MDSSQKAKFILALHKHSLAAFDGGGVIGGIGGAFQGVGSDLTAQNQYQAQLAPQQQSNYGGTINTTAGNSLAGYGQAQNIQGQQQALANQLQAQSMGAGPNPAQAALNQNTGQNVANQAALMASQRGAGSNVGLMARQAAQQGASTQQQAVGQAATLQAQQQLAAESALANQQATMGGQNIQEQGAQNQLYGLSANAQNAQNANNISNYGMMQGINGQIAQNNANAVNRTTGGLENSFSGALGLFGGSSSPGGGVGAGSAGTSTYGSGASNLGIAPMTSSLGMAKGGMVQGPQSHVGMWMSGKKYADGGTVAQVNVPQINGPQDSSGGSSGGSLSSMTALAPILLAKDGGKVKAGQKSEKAVKKDNSLKNDKIPALLSEGEIVLPRSITNHPNAPEMAARFVQAALNKRKMGK